MLTIYLLKGLPASGKSTWAKERMSQLPNGAVKRVNKDDLRAMLDDGRWSGDNEKLILNIRNHIIKQSLLKCKHVIVDDTNLHPKHEEHMKEIRKEMKDKHDLEVQVTVVDHFIETPLAACLTRDADREKPVGEQVIKNMYDKYIAKTPGSLEKRYEPNPELPNIVICDIDGTLALRNGTRSPYDWDRVGEDDMNHFVSDTVAALTSDDTDLVFFSGRDEACFEDTNDWLMKHCRLLWDRSEALVLRPAGDQRKDTIVKEEMYNQHIKGKYNVVCCVDDRPSVIRMWKSLGLNVLDVGPGVEF
jgi:predicted kinase